MKAVNSYSERNKVISTVILLFWAMMVSAQQYSVVTTKGTILYGQEKSELTRGARVNLNETLIFKDPTAMAVLIGSGGERFILKSKSEASEDSELMATIKDVLVPMKKMSALTTRGAADHKIIDLEAMIGEDNFVILGEEMALNLDEAYYPMDEKRYFIFSYFLGREAVNKKVVFEENRLFFVPSRLFISNGDPVDPISVSEAKLFYRDEIKSDTRLISTFRPIVLSEERLKEECEILIGFYRGAGMNNDAIKAEIYDYLNSFYGKTPREPLFHWLSETYQL